jgi:diadenosine tetraphosphate (Ap4A) HIT family hydrolase
VAALGNLVPQLHLHHVARFSSDAAWPGPIWGACPAIPYEEQALLGRLPAGKPVWLPWMDFSHF